MRDVAATARKVIIIGYLIVLHGVVAWLLLDKYVFSAMFEPDWRSAEVPGPSVQPLVTPTTIPSISPTAGPPAPIVNTGAPGSLMIPVHGVSADQLTDTFAQSRSEDRVHEAIDIPAAPMTPVLAAADGEIVKFHDSELGGITIYQISTDKRYFYYYAHLHSRAPNLTEKQFVTRGTTIGYVGDTGNAGAGNYHLHFSIIQVIDPKRFWDGVNLNPYPILRGETRLP